MIVVNRVSIERIIGLAPEGKAAAVIGLAEDDNEYFIKFKDNGQETPRILVGELVGAYLACLLDLPCAPPCIVDVDEDEIQLRAKLLQSCTAYAARLPAP